MARLHTLTINLTSEERTLLESGTRSGNWKARKVCRARVLLLADIGKAGPNPPLGDQEIAERSGCSKSTVGNLRKCFQDERLGALEEKPRSGRPKIVNGQIEAKMIAIACSEAPEGQQRWTLRLIAGKLVTLSDDLESISYTTVGKTLKKMNSSHG